MRAKTIHRADQDGYTECGRLIEGSGLETQPHDGSGPMVNCGTCLRQIKEYCRDCKTDVVCIRVEEYDRWADGRRYNGQANGQYKQWLRCPACNRKMVSRRPHLRGHHEYRLSEKRRLQKAREYRDAVARNHQERRDRERAQQEAERAEHGVLVRGCAACGEPHPNPGRVLPREWHSSPFHFLEWIWCPDHAAIGRAMDRTLTASFRRVAADIRAGVLERIGSQKEVTA